MVVSYVRWPYDGSYVEAPWFEYSAGDGSIVANVADMSAYVRFILNRGVGDKGRVLSESTFATLTTPVLENYAYGLWVRKENGHTVIGHSGSIGGFNAAIEAHMDEGFGLVFLCNAAIDQELKKWVVRVVTAASRERRCLRRHRVQNRHTPICTTMPVSSTSQETEHPALACLRRCAAARAPSTVGGALEFVVVQDHLFLKGERGNIPLQRMGTLTCFARLAMQPASFPSCLAAVAQDGKGKVTSVSQGALWYAG